MKTQEEQLAFANENSRLTSRLAELHEQFIASQKNGSSKEEQLAILKETRETQEMMKTLVSNYMG